ncbi:hypothetical protein [Rhodoferax sp.]|nr:hypothetical protein [Rhodoferax sp.]MDO9197470.1 hypothetical protein [Rhodoferax sp.]
MRTIEPNVGIVELPDPRMAEPGGKFKNRTGMRRFFEDFVLVLPWGN